MQVPVLNTAGQQVDTVELPDSIFGVEVNVGLMHQAYVRQMANARQGTHKVKSRGEVNRTKAKWYRQKGTGRARHGSRNAPIFVGGGVAHGPKPRDYTQAMPKKMRRGALRSLLSALVRDGQIVVVDQLTIDDHKTKTMKQVLNNLVGDASALILLAGPNENVERATHNLQNAMAIRVLNLNVRDALKHDKVILPLDALAIITDWLAVPAKAE
ncbi:MAG: 50S ribosomal protein L4 [Phototrophicales bacterium]|nr:MAG: 50S ribosomal protein L4 [Phototrophicales bacterium]